MARTSSSSLAKGSGRGLDPKAKPEQMGTKGYGKVLKRIQILEEGRVLAKEARSWKIEGQKKDCKKKYQWLLNKFEMECFYGAKGLWYLVLENVVRERGALPKKEGDVIR